MSITPLASSLKSETTVHVPIMVAPIVQCLTEALPALLLQSGEQKLWLVDCTLGGGGHTSAILAALHQKTELQGRVGILGIDQDERALERAKVRFSSEIESGEIELFHGRFSEIEDLVRSRPCVGLLADFGFSSDQIENPERGLSFRADGPLDMRLDPTRGQSARTWLLKARESEIEQVLREFGEERFSKRIAAAIVDRRRKEGMPETAKGFADFISGLMPAATRYGRIHPATRVFQAIRIQVNDELGEIERLLKEVLPQLRPGARVALMSFHSLEDRLVKIALKDREGLFVPLTKKPIEADDLEVSRNPRSRSAKLRLAERRSDEAGKSRDGEIDPDV